MRWSWAQLIKRIYEIDPLVCPSCSSELNVIAFIFETLPDGFACKIADGVGLFPDGGRGSVDGGMRFS